MPLLLLGRVLMRRKKTRTKHSRRDAHVPKPRLEKHAPEWEKVLTASLRENCQAPSDEVLLYAYDLHWQDQNAPSAARQEELAKRYSQIMADFASLQALAPDMLERAAAKQRLDLLPHLDDKGAR